MNAVLGLKEYVCDLVEQCWAVKAELGMYIVLELKESVCDLVEQSWAVKAEQ